jgi:hypothetical protein
MPRHCPNCPYQTPDLLANVCPYCNTPLALSPQGRADRPPPEVPRRSRRVWWVLGVVGLLVAVPIGYVLIVYADPELFLGDVGLQDSAGRIGVPMPADRLADALALTPAERGRVGRRGFKGSVTSARGRRLVRVTVWSGVVNGVQDADLPFPVPGWTRIADDPN